MKYKSLLFPFGLVLASCTTSISGQTTVNSSASSPLFDQALVKTTQENFQGAIEDLEQASRWYFNNNDRENAYKSSLLAEYITFEQFRRDLYITGENVYSPYWHRFGFCVETDCEYSLSWLNPSPLGSNFGGILVLEKFIRYLERSPGSATPINQVLYVSVVPALNAEETLYSHCFEDINNTDSAPNLIALVNLENDIEQLFHTNIKQLWRVNTADETIVELDVSDYPHAGCENFIP